MKKSTPTSPWVDPQELLPTDRFYSPTLRQLSGTHPELMPNPVPICVSCPAASWYVKDGSLNCCCVALRMYPWTQGGSVDLCDPRHRARLAASGLPVQ